MKIEIKQTKKAEETPPLPFFTKSSSGAIALWLSAREFVYVTEAGFSGLRNLLHDESDVFARIEAAKETLLPKGTIITITI